MNWRSRYQERERFGFGNFTLTHGPGCSCAHIPVLCWRPGVNGQRQVGTVHFLFQFLGQGVGGTGVGAAESPYHHGARCPEQNPWLAAESPWKAMSGCGQKGEDRKWPKRRFLSIWALENTKWCWEHTGPGPRTAAWWVLSVAEAGPTCRFCCTHTQAGGRVSSPGVKVTWANKVICLVQFSSVLCWNGFLGS